MIFFNSIVCVLQTMRRIELKNCGESSCRGYWRGFQQLMKKHAERYRLIDASLSPDEVFAAAKVELDSLLCSSE